MYLVVAVGCLANLCDILIHTALDTLSKSYFSFNSVTH